MPSEKTTASDINRKLWDATSAAYQAAHHAELVDDVLWGPSMPPETTLEILGRNVAGKEILELCCGGGQSAVYLAQHGAKVVGIDFSENQLEHARALAKSRGVAVRFERGDVHELSAFPSDSFDIVFSAFALGFVEDIEATFRGAFRVLRRGGFFAFSWASPLYVCVTAAMDAGLHVARSYFDRSPIITDEPEGREIDFHRTYGDWLGALVRAGFIVTDIIEPEPLARENSYRDGFPLASIRMVPGTTIWRARKPRRLDP
jgi:SAM-dependent methyltransferase